MNVAQSIGVPRWLPNAISVVRIAMVPAWLYLAFKARAQALTGLSPSGWGPALVFIAIGLSDIIDGALARRFGLATNLGATLDAVADKLAQIAAVTFLTLLGAPAFRALPMPLMIVLATRDALLAAGWLLVFRKRRAVSVEHRWHGKAASALLFALVLAALARVPAFALELGSLVVIGLIVPSTLAYLRAGWRQFSLDSALVRSANLAHKRPPLQRLRRVGGGEAARCKRP